MNLWEVYDAGPANKSILNIETDSHTSSGKRETEQDTVRLSDITKVGQMKGCVTRA